MFRLWAAWYGKILFNHAFPTTSDWYILKTRVQTTEQIRFLLDWKKKKDTLLVSNIQMFVLSNKKTAYMLFIGIYRCFWIHITCRRTFICALVHASNRLNPILTNLIYDCREFCTRRWQEWSHYSWMTSRRLESRMLVGVGGCWLMFSAIYVEENSVKLSVMDPRTTLGDPLLCLVITTNQSLIN